MSTSSLHRPVGLTSNDRGAIMVIAVFMAVFSVGILYYAVGIGQTILLREHLQDAADASALSGAIMHARGMNFLVLLNIVMAALLAILVAMKALEGLAILGMLIALALAWFTGGSSLGLIPPLKVMQQTMSNTYDAVKPPVFQALEVLHHTADIVQGMVPDATEALVLAEVGAHGVLSAHGLFWRPRTDLPVQDDGFDALCGKAGSYAADVVTAPLNKIPGLGQLSLDGVASSFTSSLSSWFCGDSGDPPPAAEQPRVETHFPQSDLAQACAADKTPVPPPAVDANGNPAKTKLCTDSQTQATEGAPDGRTGACKSDGSCGSDGAYETLAATALDQCDPSGSPRPALYSYQLRQAKVSYQWTRAGWKRLNPIYLTPQNETSDRPPCGRKEDSPSVAVGYNRAVHPRGDVNEIVPVCEKEDAPMMPSRSPSLGQIVEVPRVEVIHILGCTKSLDQKATVSKMTTAKSDGGSSKSPKMILADATLGDPNFQIRTFVTADAPADEARRVLHVSLMGAPEPTGELDAERALGNLAVAQAEYFYDAADGRGEWMWQMNWRARLTRFRLPSGDGAMDQCQGSCADLVQKLSKFSNLFVH
jgi:Putative Flp pilus-assembly TadE/G-like